MAKNVIACRIASYGKFQDRAWGHLPTIGVTNVEMLAPEPGELDAARKQLADHGLTATSLQGKCDLIAEDPTAILGWQFDACQALGVKLLFLSLKSGGLPQDEVVQRVRAVGDAAASAGVIIAVETHPDIVANGTVGAANMRAFNHPNIPVNFDTGNVYYYNHDVTAVGELAKLIDFVASVHLKDTNGQFETWHFPALGRGVVDFPEVFRMMNARGFIGPFTMELEGIKGEELDEAGQLAYVAESVEYLRRIGAF